MPTSHLGRLQGHTFLTLKYLVFQCEAQASHSRLYSLPESAEFSSSSVSPYSFIQRPLMCLSLPLGAPQPTAGDSSRPVWECGRGTEVSNFYPSTALWPVLTAHSHLEFRYPQCEWSLPSACTSYPAHYSHNPFIISALYHRLWHLGWYHPLPD